MNGDQEKLVASSQQSSSQTWGTRSNGATITTGSTVQIVLVTGPIGALGALGYFGIKFVNDAVEPERIARVSEVHEQEVRRLSEVERLSKEADRLAAKAAKLEDEGTPHSNKILAELQALIGTEKAERVGSDNVSTEKHANFEARIKTIEEREEFFMRSRVDIQSQISKLQESQRLLEHQCMSPAK